MTDAQWAIISRLMQAVSGDTEAAVVQARSTLDAADGQRERIEALIAYKQAQDAHELARSALRNQIFTMFGVYLDILA